MEATKTAQSTGFKYWLSATRDFNGGIPPLSIRIEWTATPGGPVRSTYGSFFPDDGHINWQYDAPPRALHELAVGCCFDAGDGYDDVLTGAEYMGTETTAQMEHQVAARCKCCGVVQVSEDELSEQGRCGKCHIAHLGEAA